jgi:hypothetical protein
MRLVTVSTALWCSVIPRVQQIMALGAVAYSRAVAAISSAGTPVMASARCRV